MKSFNLVSRAVNKRRCKGVSQLAGSVGPSDNL